MKIADVRKLLRGFTPRGMAFSESLNRPVALITEDELDEIPDILGDATEGDVAFLTYDDETAFAKDVEPIAFVGSRGEDGPIGQIEGLLIAHARRGALVDLMFVAEAVILSDHSLCSIDRPRRDRRSRSHPDPEPARFARRVERTLVPGSERSLGADPAARRLRAVAGA